MKGVIVAIVISAAIVCGSFLYTNRIMGISDELLAISEKVGEELQRENYAAALDGVGRIEGYIREKRIFFSVTNNHTRIDDIEMNIKKLEGYIAEGDKNDAIAHNNQISVMIEHLPEDYKVTVGNIL